MAEIDWVSSAVDAIQISICPSGTTSPESTQQFHPEYTESFFGKEQAIFGYRGLRINIRFAAHDLYPNVQISYDEKFTAVGDTKPTNVLKLFKEQMPAYAFEPAASFDARLENDELAASFKPPGELIESYTVKGRKYEIWLGELTDPAVKTLVERIQICIPFFIDGGLTLNLKDQDWTLARWRVFFVYEKLPIPPSPKSSVYSIVGYSTSYRFLTYQPSTSPYFTQNALPTTFPPPEPISISSIPNRSRISQFLILPPHQSHSHGTRLYNAMIATFLADKACIEITVEDPNESFDDLRDYADYARLAAAGSLAPITLTSSLPPALTARRPGVRVPTARLVDKRLLESLRARTKLAPRQFARLVELHLLSKIPAHSRKAGTARLTRKGAATDEGDRMFYYWRLLVKQRIYRQNRDVLVQLDAAERVEKLEETVAGQTEAYERLLEGMEKRRQKDMQGEDTGSLGTSTGRGKRKVVGGDEDEEDAQSDDIKEREKKRLKENEG